MQQPIARNDYVTGAALTSAQVIYIIRDAPAVQTSAGCELLDINLNVLSTLTNDFQGGEVSRSNYATLHASATLYIATDLDWGTAIVRPFYTMSDGVNTARFNLGAYLTSSPETQVGDSPVTHEVTCYDILHWINTPVGEAYTVAAGTGYLDAIEAIFIAQGIEAYFIDQDQTSQVLASPLSWAFDDHTTWLNICNDLASAVGYQGIWSDWDGKLRVEPYQVPQDRIAEWTYSDDSDTSMMDPKRRVVRDWFDAPNRWTFFWNQDPEAAPPVDGNGIYTFDNVLDGPTSQMARGRVIPAKPQQVEAADQNSLVSRAQRSIDADMRLKTSYKVSTFPNPLHWHFDRMVLSDPALDQISDIMSVNWKLPLDGGNMEHEWSLL